MTSGAYTPECGDCERCKDCGAHWCRAEDDTCGWCREDQRAEADCA